MKRFALLTAAIALAFTVTVSAEDKKDAKFDAAKLVGDWEYVSGTRMGESVDKDRMKGKVVVSKETFTLGSGEGKFIIGYKIDDKASPAKIDMEIKDGPVKEGKASGIISLKDNEIKLCYTHMGDRPAKFESTKDNGAFLFTLKKAK